MTASLEIIATCALGLEELLSAELTELGIPSPRIQRGAVAYRGRWADVWRSNWRLRTANRVLVTLDSWSARDGDELYHGATKFLAKQGLSWDGLDCHALFQPQRTIALRATSSGSTIRDVRWVTLRTKDGLVDAQRTAFGQRSSIDKNKPDTPLRVWLHNDHATLLLDTSGEPLDRRGYRVRTTEAPVRENIAAACVLASEWRGPGPVVDPMCGSGTLLAEAGSLCLGRPAGATREGWAFQRLPNFDRTGFVDVQGEKLVSPNPDVELLGVDTSPEALEAASENLERARLKRRTSLTRKDGFAFVPPATPGLLIVNPPYGTRLESEPGQWKRLGDLMKQQYQGWRAVVLAGDIDRGKHIGLRPRLRLPVRNGPLEARILVFDLY